MKIGIVSIKITGLFPYGSTFLLRIRISLHIAKDHLCAQWKVLHTQHHNSLSAHLYMTIDLGDAREKMKGKKGGKEERSRVSKKAKDKRWLKRMEMKKSLVHCFEFICSFTPYLNLLKWVKIYLIFFLLID